MGSPGDVTPVPDTLPLPPPLTGLPVKATVEDVRARFAEFGRLKDVRLVCLRNGHSKGLAYVEYEDEVRYGMPSDGRAHWDRRWGYSSLIQTKAVFLYASMT